MKQLPLELFKSVAFFLRHPVERGIFPHIWKLASGHEKRCKQLPAYLSVISCVENFRKDCTRPTNGVSEGTKQALSEPVCVPKTAQHTDLLDVIE